MPAQLPALANSATQTASLLLRGDDATDPRLFSSQFEFLLEKQMASGEPANPLTAILDAAHTVDSDLGEDLAALLPFIEGLGLTQTLPTQVGPADSSSIATSQSQPLDAAIGVLVAPVTPNAAVSADTPAISAAQGQAPRLPDSLPLPQSSGPAAQTSSVEMAPVQADANGAPDFASAALSAGREFSSQLVAALAMSKETAHTPGQIAAAVQQVIAQNNPAQVQAHHDTPAIAQAVGALGWAEEIGNRIAWLASKSESRADLVLTPPQMGRIEISLTIKGDQAAASFVSSNPVVREALEAALPRLREVLADAGIQLGQAQVGAENARQWAQQEKHGENFASDRERELPAHAAISQASSGSLSTVTGLKGGRGLVDVFA